MIELSLNRIDKEWWIELGISFHKTKYHPNKNFVFTIAFVFFTLYIRI